MCKSGRNDDINDFKVTVDPYYLILIDNNAVYQYLMTWKMTPRKSCCHQDRIWIVQQKAIQKELFEIDFYCFLCLILTYYILNQYFKSFKLNIRSLIPLKLRIPIKSLVQLVQSLVYTPTSWETSSKISFLCNMIKFMLDIAYELVSLIEVGQTANVSCICTLTMHYMSVTRPATSMNLQFLSKSRKNVRL